MAVDQQLGTLVADILYRNIYLVYVSVVPSFTGYGPTTLPLRLHCSVGRVRSNVLRAVKGEVVSCGGGGRG